MLNLQQNPYESKKKIKRYFEMMKKMGLIMGFEFEKDKVIFYIRPQLNINQQKRTGFEKLVSIKEHNLFGKELVLMKEKDLNLEIDLQKLIEKYLTKNKHVDSVKSFYPVKNVGIIDTLVTFKNGKQLIIEYKFNSDKRVVSQVLGYSFYLSNQHNLDVSDIEVLIIQKDFRKGDYGILSYIENLYFYKWEQHEDFIKLLLG